MIFINLDNYTRNLNYMHIVLRPTKQNLNSAILILVNYLKYFTELVSYNKQNYSHTCNLFNKVPSAFQNTMQMTSDINLLLHFLLRPS